MGIIDTLNRFLKTKIIKDINNVHLLDLSLLNKNIEIKRVENFCLPYDECFIKLTDKIFVYLSEKHPELYNITFIIDGPYKITYYTHTLKIENGKKMLYPETDDFSYERLEQDGKILNILLNVLNKISYSTHNLYKTNNFDIFFKDRANKIHKKYKKPIYIYVKQDPQDIVLLNKNYNNCKLIRQFAWSVRGHWRKLHNVNTLGKNKAGDYIVEGFTWVKDFIKGNKNELPETKLYIVK